MNEQNKDLERQILEQEQQRLQEQEVRAQRDEAIQRYTKAVIGQFRIARQLILDAVAQTNESLPDALRVATGSLNQQQQTLLLVRRERYVSLSLERINSNGWIGLRLTSGQCRKTKRVAAGAEEIYDVELFDNAYQICFWARYSEFGSQFNWTYSVPKPCSHETWFLPPHGVRCKNCGQSVAGSYTNEQLARLCLVEFGKTRVPHHKSSPAPSYDHSFLQQSCRYRDNPPPPGPNVGP